MKIVPHVPWHFRFSEDLKIQLSYVVCFRYSENNVKCVVMSEIIQN
jgi:hypothetical protein